MTPCEQSQLQTAVLHLASACPHDDQNPDFCPLHHLRERTDVEKHNWVQNLTPEDLEYLSRYHEVCLQVRSLEPNSPDHNGSPRE